MNCYVFFDVDDTLVEWRVTWPEAFIRAAGEAGVVVSREWATEKLTEAMNEYYHECVIAHCQPGPANDLDFWLDYDGRILAAMGVPGDTRPYAAVVWDMLQAPGAIALYDEVAEVVQELAAGGARLGIITGRPSAEPDLTRLGLGHYFDPMLDAFGTASTKRETRMFELAAQAAAAAGLPAWHVGDSYALDVLPARAVGMQPVLIDRAGSHPTADCHRIANLREVLALLA